MAIEVFNRYEYKYLITREQFDKISNIIKEYMVSDKYNKNGNIYTISNIYYDTSDDYLIRTSLSKPVYKEKLRLRAYGIPNEDSIVFLEIKKKFKGIVNKRRTSINLVDAYEYLNNGILPDKYEYTNVQVSKEIDYFVSRYNLVPKVYIAYDRIAFFDKEDHDLRVSFDFNIRSRRDNLFLESGDHGTYLLDDDLCVMEIKTSYAIPLWLAESLTEFGIKKTRFSKYGTEYKKLLLKRRTKIGQLI